MKNIEAYQASDNQWYIQITNARNGKVIGTAHEGHTRKASAVRAIRNNWRDGYSMKLIRDTATSIKFRMVPHVA